jgi:hypothetical protein
MASAGKKLRLLDAARSSRARASRSLGAIFVGIDTASSQARNRLAVQAPTVHLSGRFQALVHRIVDILHCQGRGHLVQTKW